jgi:pyruvate carboxylase
VQGLRRYGEMTKIETYNYFTCPECDPEGITRLNLEEFKKHLFEVHQITDAKGKRSMISHIDGRMFYQWTLE